MTADAKSSNVLSREQLVKYLDHLARCYRGVLQTVSNDPQRFALVTAADERAVQQAANALRLQNETSALPEYTREVGDAGEAYLKSVSPGGYRLAATFRWSDLWDAMCKAARPEETTPKLENSDGR